MINREELSEGLMIITRRALRRVWLMINRGEPLEGVG